LTITLSAGDCTAVVDATAGGRVAQIYVDDQPLLIGPDDLTNGSGAPSALPIARGLFPMAPWAGRIGSGKFTFDGIAHQLGINIRDSEGKGRDHAIHGTVFTRPWTVLEQTGSSLSMLCPLTGALDWPYEGTARQHIQVRDSSIVFALTVESALASFPAEVGWHPWFRKPQRLSFEPTAMYERDEMDLPTGELIAPSTGPWDDCFLNSEPVTLHYDRPQVSEIRVESDCDHWMIFDEPTHATCVEPQSGPPDAFRLGPHVVKPGDPLQRTMSISW